MKTTLNAKNSRAAIKFVAGIVPRRSTLPILSNVRCYANGHFEMTATDLDVTLQAECESQTQQDGLVTIPARALIDACAGKDDFELESGEHHSIAIRAGGNSRNVLSLAPDDFPPVLDIPAEARRLTFPAVDFLAALQAVAIAQSSDSSRYVLNGVCLEITAAGVQLVATDGRRLHLAQLAGSGITAEAQTQINAARLAGDMAQKDVDAARELYPPQYVPAKDADLAARGYFEQAAAQEFTDAVEVLERAQSILAKLTAATQILLPAMAVKHILRLPLDKKAAGEITVCHWENKNTAGLAAVLFGNYRIITKLIEGNYPNYRQVIPAECKLSVRVNVAEFRGAVAVAEKATSAKSNSVRLDFAANLLTVTGETPEIGKASAQMPVNYSGAQFAIAFNPGYVLEACEAFSGAEAMELQFVDELSPVKIVNAHGLSVVIMPMRLS